MGIKGVHHFSFTVTNVERTIEFYLKLFGAQIQSRRRNKYETLGTALFGTKWGVNQPQADLEIAVVKVGDTQIEFIQYFDPKAKPYHLNPSIAGSAHLAFKVDDIEKEMERLKAAGVEFHSPVNIFKVPEKPEWKWCYFRDPDGICVEMVEQRE